MTATPVGHRRTGLCPTFARPSLQRDGYLLRLALVGGSLDIRQVDTVATVGRRYGSGVIELTNRGNLQVRGLAADARQAALEACADVGLGDVRASLITISPFAGPVEHLVREKLLEALDGFDVSGLSPRFAAHVDDPEGLTADRSCDVLVKPESDSRCKVAVRGLGTTTCLTSSDAARLVRRLMACCIGAGPRVRTADLVLHDGVAAVARELDASAAWQPAPSQPVPVSMQLQTGLQHLRPGEHVVLAGARFGRVDAHVLAGLGQILCRQSNVTLRVTPWRSLAFTCVKPAQAHAVLHAAAALGLLTDPSDPALGVVTCIGVRGCWQTELDTLAEAERFVSNRRPDLPASGIVHISGCDKRCATRSTVALTLLGRNDQTGFEEVWPDSE